MSEYPRYGYRNAYEPVGEQPIEFALRTSNHTSADSHQAHRDLFGQPPYYCSACRCRLHTHQVRTFFWQEPLRPKESSYLYHLPTYGQPCGPVERIGYR